MPGAVAVYVHLPWCVRKCPYCDFNSHEAGAIIPEAQYVAALKRDLDFDLADFNPSRISSVFFGGGTPSLFSGKAIAQILEYLNERIGFVDDCEITLEANPGAIDQKNFNNYRAAGVNRLSIGAQSFRADMLARLGRIHEAGAIRDAVHTARAAGFDNFNIDLMYALPCDSVQGSNSDLQAALALEPTHLSWYQLTLEPGTAFHRKPPPLPDEDLVCEIEASGHELLAAAGFERYEVSAWARGDSRCQHNVNYWRFGDYLGIGAGAHGKLTTNSGSDYLRTAKARSPVRYQNEAGSERVREQTAIEKPYEKLQEFLLGALRLQEGFSLDEAERLIGLRADPIRNALSKAAASGFVCEEAGRLRLNARGLQYLDAVLADLVLPN